jgi:hypothetical protein
VIIHAEPPKALSKPHASKLEESLLLDVFAQVQHITNKFDSRNTKKKIMETHYPLSPPMSTRVSEANDGSVKL